MLPYDITFNFKNVFGEDDDTPFNYGYNAIADVYSLKLQYAFKYSWYILAE